MASKHPPATVVERAHFLLENGWKKTADGLWIHPGLYYPWTLEAAARLTAEAKADKKLGELVHLMVLGLA